MYSFPAWDAKYNYGPQLRQGLSIVTQRHGATSSVASMAFIQGVACLLFHTQFTDLYECTNSAQHFCTHPSVNAKYYIIIVLGMSFLTQLGVDEADCHSLNSKLIHKAEFGAKES